MNRKIIILVGIAAVQCGLVNAGTADGMFGDMWPTYVTATNSAATTTNITQAGAPAGNASLAGSIIAAMNAPVNNPPPAAGLSTDHFVTDDVTAQGTAGANEGLSGNDSGVNPAPAEENAAANKGAAPKGYFTATPAPAKGNAAAKGGTIQKVAIPTSAPAKGNDAADKAAAGNDAVIGDLVKNIVVPDKAPVKARSLANNVPSRDNTVAGTAPAAQAGGKGTGAKKATGIKSVPAEDAVAAQDASSRSKALASQLMRNVMGADKASVKEVNVTANGGPPENHGVANTAQARQILTASDGSFKSYVARNNAHGAEDLMASTPPLAGTASPGLPAIQLPSTSSENAPGASQVAPGLPAIAAPAAGATDNNAGGSDNSGASTEDTSDEVTNLMYSLDDQYRLGPGDTIVYQVVEDQDSPTNLVLTDSGDLEVPYYGLVHAGGKTCQELAEQVKSLLEKNLYYQATVVIALGIENKNWVTGKVYVTGQVKNPGSYPIPSTENMTVSKAILAAGGFSDFSDQKHVRLIRKGEAGDQAYIINVVDIWKGNVSKDLEVQPGDMVVVPARLINY